MDGHGSGLNIGDQPALLLIRGELGIGFSQFGTSLGFLSVPTLPYMNNIYLFLITTLIFMHLYILEILTFKFNLTPTQSRRVW